MAYDTEYGRMDDEELAQLQEAYRKLGQPVPPRLQDELESRIAKNVVDQVCPRESTKVRGSATVANAPAAQPVQQATENRTSKSVSRRQMVYLRVGLFLLVTTILFPPWSFKYPGISYGFLFHPPDRASAINLSVLFAEWVLMALVTSGFFLSQAKRSTATGQERDALDAAGPSSMKGGSYFKVNYPGLAREFIGHVDDRERVTLWQDGQPTPTGLTRDQLLTYGVQFEAATEDAITRLYGPKNSKTFRLGKLWRRELLVPIIAGAAICALGGLGYYFDRRMVRELPPNENSKLAGGASIGNYGQFMWEAYNGSDFVLTEVRISISVFDEKGNAIVSNRVYRVPAYDFYPQQTKELSTGLGFSLGQDQKWSWFIVEAKGRPE